MFKDFPNNNNKKKNVFMKGNDVILDKGEVHKDFLFHLPGS